MRRLEWALAAAVWAAGLAGWYAFTFHAIPSFVEWLKAKERELYHGK